MKQYFTFFPLGLLLLATSNLGALTISIYHTSDVHGWYFPRPARWHKANPERLVGGFAALSSLINKDKSPHLLLDSGDTYQGNPEGTLTRGRATVQLMNRLGYAASAVGNHDYDFGEEVLKARSAESNFPWLAGNITEKKTGKIPAYLKPYRFVTIAGKKIAIIGLAGRHTTTSTLPLNVKALNFKNENEEAARLTAEVKKEKPDAIIILAHLGISDNLASQKIDISTWTFTGNELKYGTLAIARAAKDATVVFGGHTHTALLKGYKDPKTGTLIAESWSTLTDASKVVLEFDDITGKLTGAKDELISLWTDETGEDPEITKLLAPYTEEVEGQMKEKIGETAQELNISPDGINSLAARWATDALRRGVKTELAFQNTAGIRAPIKKGTVTMRDMYQIMPFENTAVTMKITGAQIERLMRDNLKGGKARMQVSGIVVKFKLDKDGNPAEIILEKDGKKVTPEQTFTAVTNNYLSSGGTGGQVLSECSDIKDTLLPIRELMTQDIRLHSPIQMDSNPVFIHLP